MRLRKRIKNDEGYEEVNQECKSVKILGWDFEEVRAIFRAERLDQGDHLGPEK